MEHFADGISMSWYDLAKKIVVGQVTIVRKRTTKRQQKALRPINTTLLNTSNG